MIRTVTGDIAPGSLGPTLMHEHVLCDLTHPSRRHEPAAQITPDIAFEARYHWNRVPGVHRLDDRDTAVRELERFKEAGGHLVVDLTSEGIGPDPEGLAQVSRRSGVAIVRGCGTYVAAHAGEALLDASVDTLAARMIEAVRVGTGGVRAGIIGEIGLSEPWHPAEERALVAAALASRETGAAVNVHPSREPDLAIATIDTFSRAGGDPQRLVLSHMDRTFQDADGPLRLAERGAVVEWDFFGINDAWYPFGDIELAHDGGRLDLVRALIDRGHLTRVAISHDICTKPRLARWGGHGYAHIPRNVVPLMRRKGFSDEEIHTLLVATPRRLLSLGAGRPAQ